MRKYYPFYIPEDKPGLFPLSLNFHIIFDEEIPSITKKKKRFEEVLNVAKEVLNVK